MQWKAPMRKQFSVSITNFILVHQMRFLEKVMNTLSIPTDILSFSVTNHDRYLFITREKSFNF